MAPSVAVGIVHGSYPSTIITDAIGERPTLHKQEETEKANLEVTNKRDHSVLEASHQLLKEDRKIKKNHSADRRLHPAQY